MSNLRVVTESKRQLNLTAERLGEIRERGIAFKNNHFDHDYSCVLNDPFGWVLRDCILTDQDGEFRKIAWGEYPDAINFSTWLEYDTAKKEKNRVEHLAFLESRNELCGNYEMALRKIRTINEQGGPGSRKAVREIISSLNI